MGSTVQTDAAKNSSSKTESRGVYSMSNAMVATPNATENRVVPHVRSRERITIEAAMALAEIYYRGGMGGDATKPVELTAKILAGDEIGLQPLQSCKEITVTRGRATVSTCAATALVRASGLCDYIHDSVAGDGMERTGTCVVKRRGEAEKTSTFSMAEAKRAGLIARSESKGGGGPWVSYPDRMLRARATGFAMRDVFPDVLAGMVTTEEARDYEDAVVLSVNGVSQAANEAPKALAAKPASAVVVPPAMANQSHIDAIKATRDTWLSRQANPPDPFDQPAIRLWWVTYLRATFGGSVDSVAKLTAEQADSLVANLAYAEKAELVELVDFTAENTEKKGF